MYKDHFFKNQGYFTSEFSMKGNPGGSLGVSVSKI